MKIAEPQRHRLLDRRRAQFPRARGAAAPLRHRGAEELLPAAPRARRGSAVLRAHRSARRLRRASIPDTGVVCRGMWQGREIVGLKLNFSKRYITLAPVATVIGLAFRMFDPERLLGRQSRPRHHLRADPARHARASTIGRRHFPLNVPFQNGPIQGTDVFVPLDSIIGGSAMAGQRLAHAGRAALGRAAASRCPRTPPAARRRQCGRPAPTRASAANSTCPSAASRASSRCSRAWSASPTSWMPRARSPPARSTAARSPRCPPRCSSIT